MIKLMLDLYSLYEEQHGKAPNVVYVLDWSHAVGLINVAEHTTLWSLFVEELY